MLEVTKSAPEERYFVHVNKLLARTTIIIQKQHDADAPEKVVPTQTKTQNPPSQTMRIEDTPVSEVVQEVQAPAEEIVKTQEAPAEEEVLDKGIEAVKKARSRRRGIADATGE